MIYEVIDRPLEIGRLETAVRHPGAGGVVTFVGYVRATSDDDRAVDGLVYEAHVDLAVAEFRTIADEAFARFPGARVAIAHRIGALEVGEAAVAVAVAAPHRAEAFDACRYAIDELKRRATIWKQERYRDGDATWRANPA